MKPHRLAVLPLLALTLAAATAEAQTTVMDCSTLPSAGNGAAALAAFGSHANLAASNGLATDSATPRSIARP